MKTSADAYRMIHAALADWISACLDHGFEVDPVKSSLAEELTEMAAHMRAIEQHTDIVPQEGEG